MSRINQTFLSFSRFCLVPTALGSVTLGFLIRHLSAYLLEYISFTYCLRQSYCTGRYHNICSFVCSSCLLSAFAFLRFSISETMPRKRNRKFVRKKSRTVERTTTVHYSSRKKLDKFLIEFAAYLLQPLLELVIFSRCFFKTNGQILGWILQSFSLFIVHTVISWLQVQRPSAGGLGNQPISNRLLSANTVLESSTYESTTYDIYWNESGSLMSGLGLDPAYLNQSAVPMNLSLSVLSAESIGPAITLVDDEWVRSHNPSKLGLLEFASVSHTSVLRTSASLSVTLKCKTAALMAPDIVGPGVLSYRRLSNYL